MKRILALIVTLVFFASSTAFAGVQAECLGKDGKMKNCFITIEDGNLIVDYKLSKGKDEDYTIPGKNITAISRGEYARRRVGESIGIAAATGGIGFLFIMLAKKKRDNYGVEYVTDNGNKDALMFSIKKKYTIGLATQLKAISGQPIVGDDVGSANE